MPYPTGTLDTFLQHREARGEKKDGQQQMLSEPLVGTAPPSSCRLVEFEHAFVTNNGPAGRVLVVKGTAPSTRMDVFLSHRVYPETPDWWGIEVVGALPGGICLTESREFETAIPLDAIAGRRGIEVIGAGSTVKLELAQPAIA